MSNSFVMILQNTAGAEADIKLLYIQLFLGKTEHLDVVFLSFTLQCPLQQAKWLSACACSLRCLRFLESHESTSEVPSCQGSD